jgi:CheY-like chemotaxis protein
MMSKRRSAHAEARGPRSWTRYNSQVPVLKQARALVVEDHAPLRYAMQVALVRRGFTVDEAGTAGEALRLVQANQYCSILLDMGLPDFSGTSVIDAIVSRPLPNPIVIVTGKHDRFDEFDPAVVQMVIRKPADQDMIAEMLVSLCGAQGHDHGTHPRAGQSDSGAWTDRKRAT